MKQTISRKQFGIMIFIIAVSSKIFMLPALIMGISGRDSWLTLLMFFVVEMFVLFCILFANKKNPKATVYEFLETLVGKLFSKVILCGIVFFYFFKATVLISEIKVFFTVTATESLSWQLCLVPFLIVLGAMSLKTLRGLGRVGELIIPILFLGFIVLGLIMAKNVEITNLLPMFENGVRSNFDSFLLLPVWLADFSILTIFLGRVEQRKKLMTFSVISAILAFAVILYFNIIMFSTYGYAPNLLDYGHNLTNMILYPSGTYNYGRIDLVIFSIWMLGIMIHIALLFYAVCRHITKISGIKNNYITALISISILFVLIEFIFPDELKLYSYSVSIFNYIAFVVEILFPLLILGSAFRYKKKFERERRLSGFAN